MRRLFFLVCGVCMLASTLYASEALAWQALLPVPPSFAGPNGPRAVLLVAFGTSHPKALTAYTAIDADFRAAYPDGPVAWAYTSGFIRKKMAKNGTQLFSVSEALDALAAKGVKTLVVQSLHVAAGEEFSEMERELAAWLRNNPDRFSSARLGRPLFESLRDREEVISAVLNALPAERAANEAVVLMGHGQAHGRAELVLDAVARGFAARDPLVRMATVEGSLTLDPILEDLRTAAVPRVWLQPLMIVAGDHAINDLLGEEPDTWAMRVRAAGMDWKGLPQGLGELAAVRAVFVRHAAEALDELAAQKPAQ